jgi:3-methyl-2-oxobutanoate hydroxymethyltransferase
MVADMPMGSYEASDELAVTSAQRLIKETGAQTVKLEAGGVSARRAAAIVAAGIPVMGHLGLTPQTATALGGYKAQGKTSKAAIRMYEDALALQDAGCFAVVFEAVPADIATTIAERLDIVTIGIGAGAGTSGQVLVFHDLLGITTGHMAKFVKQYADVHAEMTAAVGRYAEEVRGGSFPGPEHAYAIDDSELAEFRRHVDDEALASAKSWEWEPLS